MEEIRILSPNAILGYGFPKSSFEEGLRRRPHVIAIDAGSTDAGPYYLGEGVSFTSENAVKRDLEYILLGASSLKIPILIGTAGGAGAKEHVEWLLKIIDELVKDKQIKFKKSIIYSDIDKKYLMDKLKDGKVSKTTVEPMLTNKDISESVRLVAQIGIEAFLEGLNRGSDLISQG